MGDKERVREGKNRRAGKGVNKKGSPMSFYMLLEVDRASLGGGNMLTNVEWSSSHPTGYTG